MAPSISVRLAIEALERLARQLQMRSRLEYELVEVRAFSVTAGRFFTLRR